MDSISHASARTMEKSCKDQILRTLLKGIQIKYREEEKQEPARHSVWDK